MTTAIAHDVGDAASACLYSGLETAFDAVSRRHLTRTGLGPGWDCWEVGAGGGSVARWLADCVLPPGSVLATDVDLTAMALERRPNLRVMEHDLVGDPLPVGEVDCVHARLVLGHLPERDGALARLTLALAPGGWLVVEDLDLDLPPCPEESNPDERLVHTVRSAFAGCLSELRGDTGWARGLPGRLRALGLIDVGVSTHAAAVTGGSAAASIERDLLLQAADQLVAFGVATEADTDRCVQLLGDSDFRFTMPAMISAWGRRPPPRTEG